MVVDLEKKGGYNRVARYRGPVCRLCRREGLKLFFKGQRCLTEKCAFNDRKSPPGPPTKRKPKNSGYALQLREKQKVKRIYGVLEKPFRNYFKKAQRMKGITGENLLVLLERRLDNTIYRMGIASSRAQARNFIAHGHIQVSGRKVNIPSFQVDVDHNISVSEKKKESLLIASNIEVARGIGLIGDWLEMDADGKSGKIIRLPSRDNIDIPIKEQVVVELYSK